MAVLATGWLTPGSASVPAGARPAGQAAKPELTSFRVAPAGATEQLALSWSYGTAPVTRLHLDLYSIAAGNAVRLGSTIVGNTVEPRSYSIPVPPGTWAVRATPENASGFGVGITSAAVTVRNSCASAGLCVTVTNPSRRVAIRLAGQGFLNGTSSWTTSRISSALTPLAPKQLRAAGSAAHARAAQVHASSTQVLSDLWNNATARFGYAQTPWSDWNRWKSFVASTVATAERQGWAPNYWDVWNEPNGTCCPRFSPVDLATASVDKWLETYVVAWQAIKSVDPRAQVIGPSLSALQWAPGSPSEFDLDTFLAYSAAHHVVWSAISWHENTNAPSPGDIASSVTNVDRHVAMARAVMARHPGTVTGNRIFVNEYDPASTHLLAGWAVGYFHAFEADGVSQANLACWDAGDCTTDLDGLLTPTGQPTAVWWAHRAYAQLAGQPQMTVGTNAAWQLDGLATRDDAHHTLRVLLGRHYSCNEPVNPWCTYDAHIAPTSVSMSIAWPYGSAPVTVTTNRLPAGDGALRAPVVIGTTRVRPVNGRLSVRVASVADGDALSIVARPA